MTSNDRPFVSVVIPVRNEGQRVKAAVTSIIAGRSTDFPLQIVLVDDNSSDGCCEGLSSVYSSSYRRVQLNLIRLPRWSGIPYARNVGASAAQADTMFITDANIRFPSHWDVPIWDQIGENRVLCATIADKDSPFKGYGCVLEIPSMTIVWLRHPGIYRGYVPISPCTGTIISTALFRRAGGYDTAMPIYGAAEPEFSVRLWLTGAEIIVLPGLVLSHRFRPAPERKPFLDAIRQVQLQNFLRFGMLYLDQLRLLQMLQHYAGRFPSLFQQALRNVWTIDTWNRRELLEKRLPGRFGAFVRRFGLRDATGHLAA